MLWIEEGEKKKKVVAPCIDYYYLLDFIRNKRQHKYLDDFGYI